MTGAFEAHKHRAFLRGHVKIRNSNVTQSLTHNARNARMLLADISTLSVFSRGCLAHSNIRLANGDTIHTR